jgi:hypothetical protein
VAKLSFGIAVFFQRPVGRRREHQMHRFRLQFHAPRIAQEEIVAGRNPLDRLFDQPDKPCILGDGRNGRLRVG